MEITTEKKDLEQMRKDIEELKGTRFYKRLLEYHENISKKQYTREDLGF